MPNANPDRGANHDAGGVDTTGAARGANALARNAADNKVAAEPDRNGGVHNSGDAAGKDDNNRHDDDGRR